MAQPTRRGRARHSRSSPHCRAPAAVWRPHVAALKERGRRPGTPCPVCLIPSSPPPLLSAPLVLPPSRPTAPFAPAAPGRYPQLLDVGHSLRALLGHGGLFAREGLQLRFVAAPEPLPRGSRAGQGRVRGRGRGVVAVDERGRGAGARAAGAESTLYFSTSKLKTGISSSSGRIAAARSSLRA